MTQCSRNHAGSSDATPSSSATPRSSTAYGARPPYPAALDPLFIELAGGADAHILDLGCGTGGAGAPAGAAASGPITAVDQSANMIAQARALPGGDAPNLTWIVGRVEDVRLTGPFSSALAGQSFHWFDWPVLVRRLAEWLPTRRLVLAERREGAVAVVRGARRTLPPLLDQQATSSRSTSSTS